MTRGSSWLNLGILANMAKGSQEQPRKLLEQPKSLQESLGRAPGWIWASCTLASPRGHCMSLAVGVGGGQPGAAQEAPGAAQEHRGVARRSSWLVLGILRNMAQGSQEQPRKRQEQPNRSQD